MSKMPLSYSRLSTFESCPSKFEHLYVNKTVKDVGSVHTEHGNRVHEALEAYGKAKDQGVEVAKDMLSDGTAFAEIKTFLPLVDLLLGFPGTKYFEHQMAITAAKQPCDWFAPDVWLRGIADILIVNDDKAFIGDWKTGKVKENLMQLKLFACLVFALFPEVNVVKTAFVWLAYNEVTDARFTRDQLADLWATLDPRFAAVQAAVDLGVFKSKPSGLCNWCPAKGICPDRRGR